MSLKDVNAKATALEAKLNGKLFLGGAKPTAEDVKAFNDLLGNGNLAVYRWAKNLATFSEGERHAWGAAVTVTAPEQAAAPAEHPKEEKKHAEKKHVEKKHEEKKHEEKKAAPAPAAEEEDDVDLFGETTEEEKAALEAKHAADAAKKKKAAGTTKSSILFDVKAWEDTTDLEALAAKLKAIEKPGLLWGAHKLVPVAFGVKKLQMLIVIDDDKVSGDDLEEMVMSFEDEVQSMDIVAWNKV